MILEKVQVKIVNAVICGKKLNARATGNKLIFYSGLNLCCYVEVEPTQMLPLKFILIKATKKMFEIFQKYVDTRRTVLCSTTVKIMDNLKTLTQNLLKI